MRRLRITNMKTVDEWEPLRGLPRVLVREERSISPCDTCPGHCCTHAAELSAVEAARIGLTLILPLESFLATRPWKALGSGYDIQGSHPILLDEGLVRLFLRREEGAACRFLHDVDGRGRCAAYAVRPGVCRLYPYAVEEEDGTRAAIGTLDSCPTGWLYDESTEEAVARSLASWREDLSLDEELCQRWNDEDREARSLSAFARFIVTEMAPRLGLDERRLYPPERRAFGSRVKA